MNALFRCLLAITRLIWKLTIKMMIQSKKICQLITSVLIDFSDFKRLMFVLLAASSKPIIRLISESIWWTVTPTKSVKSGVTNVTFCTVSI